ncbi:terminase small subunit [Clostridium gasigenes]|uniref:Terminase small subunit n=1 Tax=Clostridium gasigenes TaxID=94869 RepID=A0A7X0VT31_9CLOT|nr:terminase small subunit [Clostridium gasigenes]MBB6716355.1 terminase small subunit [Clostridium gasigenes]
MKLTEKQKIFTNEYLVDLNATRAYKVAYKSCKKDETAAANGNRLLRNDKVREYLDIRLKKREERTEITQDKVIKELASIAFANGSDFAKVVEKSYMKPIKNDAGEVIGEEEVFYKTVELVKTEELDEGKKKAIAGIKQGKFGIEVQSCDKVKALELLGKHLGMFTDRVELSGSIPVQILDDIK